MNLSHPLKFHIFSYFKPFILYFVSLLIAIVISSYTFKNTNNIYLYITISSIICSLGFTILSAIYEYNRLINHYFHLKSIKNEFYFASIIYSIANALLHTLILAITYFILGKIQNKDLTNVFAFHKVTTYVFIFFVHLAVFALSCLITLLLKKIKYIQIIIYALILIIVGLISIDLTKSILLFIQHLFANSKLILTIIPILILSAIVSWGSIYLIIQNQIN